MSRITDVTCPDSSLPVSGWQLFRALTSGKLTPGWVWENPAYRRRFLIRSLAMPFSTFNYLRLLARQPLYPQLLHIQPGLPCRVHRPWLSTVMNQKQTAESIFWHYENMLRLLPAKLANGYFSRTGTVLAVLAGKDESLFSLTLRADEGLDREGEATLLLCNAQHNTLAKVTFALCHYAGKNTLYIGGLQGPKANVPHEVIQSATKACHGLFPKRLLLESLMTLAEFLDVEAVRAVSNETHIYRSLRYRKKKKEKLLADYNCFWESLGAIASDNGDYILPHAIARKPMAEIASKKRAEYRRRYVLLDSLRAQIENHFHA
ncbi:VirK/YbjX family protein [Vagococcus sp. WN89Y]|uniref:VirK/YbjX family protein n=1 Tax=Vagococcus sp. WN89Y TaxID=3457258 RepID=UPI003FCC4537